MIFTQFVTYALLHSSQEWQIKVITLTVESTLTLNCVSSHWGDRQWANLLSLTLLGEKMLSIFFWRTYGGVKTTYPVCLWCSSPMNPSSDCSCAPRSSMARNQFGSRHCGRATTSLNHPGERGAHFFGCQVPGPAGPCSPTWLQQSPPLSFFMESSCEGNKDLSEPLSNNTFRVIEITGTKC